MNQHNSDGSNPGYRHTILDAPGNFWDRSGLIGRAFAVVGLVMVCAFVGVVVLV